MKASKLNRRLHRWGAVLIIIPLAIIVCSGILLQFKKQSDWIQPPAQRGAGGEPVIEFNSILAAVQDVPEAGVKTWEDIDRLDVRPGKGIVKVRCKNRWEIQIDTATGAVLQVSPRRSDLIESIHDGTFFHERAKLWIFFPTALLLIGLLGTGIYLFLLPYITRNNRNARG